MEELKKRIREELGKAGKKMDTATSGGDSEIYFDGKASAFAEMIEIVEEMEKEEGR